MLLVARLFMAGEIKLMLEAATSTPPAPPTRSPNLPASNRVSILKRKTADATTCAVRMAVQRPVQPTGP